MPTRLAIIGAGWITKTAYLPALLAETKIVTTLVFDPDCHAAAHLSMSLPGSRRARNLAECFAPEIDAVLICVPSPAHLQIVSESLAADKFTLCEKPVIRNIEERLTLERIPNAAFRLMGSATTRMRTDVNLLLSWIREGWIGEVKSIKVGWWRRHGVPRPGSWRTNPALCPTGVLEDLGPHLLDIVSAATCFDSAFHSVTFHEAALTCRFGNSPFPAAWLGHGPSERYEVPDFCRAVFSISNGSTVEFEVSWANPQLEFDRSEITFVGTEGSASVNGLFGFSTSKRDNHTCILHTGKKKECIAFPIQEPMQQEGFEASIKRFSQFCSKEASPIAGISDIINVANWLHGIASHRDY